jgi:hypothetical protein
MSEISEIEINSMTKEQNYMRGYEDGKSDVLDKLIVEIDSHCSDNRDRNDGLYIAMKIIDRYRNEVSS